MDNETSEEKRFDIAEKGEIVLYEPDSSIRLEVRMADETVWLTQQQMAILFGTQRAAITKHLNNIYKSGEIDQESTCSILEHMGRNGTRTYSKKYYNLDAILSVGYRVNSKYATQFRRWATHTLKEYLLQGYSINQPINCNFFYSKLKFKMESRSIKLF